MAYFDLSLTNLTLHIFHQNKKDLSDATNVSTAEPERINPGLQKGFLERSTMPRLGESLIYGGL